MSTYVYVYLYTFIHTLIYIQEAESTKSVDSCKLEEEENFLTHV
jgi:hypothetical protein